MAHRAPGWGAATQLVEVVSDPIGAQGAVDGRSWGTTPVRIVLERRNSQSVVRLEKDGYLPAEVPLKRTVSGWVALNMALALYSVHPNGFADNPESRKAKVGIGLGLASTALIIDFANGAAYNLPSRVNIRLKPSGSKAPGTAELPNQRLSRRR
jgi:hypothetical protein